MSLLNQEDIPQSDLAHVLSYCDPFNRESQAPKIPDDKVESSTGIKVRNSVNIRTLDSTFPTKSNKYGYYVVLCGGVNQSFYIYKYDIDNQNLLTVNSETIYVGNNGSPYSFSIKEDPVGSGDFYFDDNSKNYDMYRIVSSGLKIKSGGPRSNVSGVYFSKSVPIGSHQNWMFVNNPPSTLSADGVSVLPYFKLKDEVMLNDLLTNGTWSNVESFRVDSQVDMALQLNQDMLNHNRAFIKTERMYRPDPTGLGGPTQELEIASSMSRADDRDMLTTGLDHGFNMWVIDIRYPNDNTSILFESVVNYELIANQSSIYNQFMTPNDFSPKVNLRNAVNAMENHYGSRSYINISKENDPNGLFKGGMSGGTGDVNNMIRTNESDVKVEAKSNNSDVAVDRSVVPDIVESDRGAPIYNLSNPDNIQSNTNEDEAFIDKLKADLNRDINEHYNYLNTYDKPKDDAKFEIGLNTNNNVYDRRTRRPNRLADGMPSESMIDRPVPPPGWINPYYHQTGFEPVPWVPVDPLVPPGRRKQYNGYYDRDNKRSRYKYDNWR